MIPQINYCLYILQKNIIPPRLNHWKTPILFSVILWCLAAGVKSGFYYHLLINLSWLSLTLGLGWVTTQKPFIIGSFAFGYWVIGGLICLFLYNNDLITNVATLVISWPVISVCFAAFFELGQCQGKLEKSWIKIRPQFLILLLTHLLLSCWLGFHFLIQDILKQYPSLLAQDFSQSTIVISFQRATLNRSRGVTLINIMEQLLIDRTRNQPWIDIEALFYRNRMGQTLQREVWERMQPLEENALWELKTPLTQGTSRYNLELQAIWQGPSLPSQKYKLIKSCNITRAGTLAEVQCTPIKVKWESEGEQDISDPQEIYINS